MVNLQIKHDRLTSRNTITSQSCKKVSRAFSCLALQHHIQDIERQRVRVLVILVQVLRLIQTQMNEYLRDWLVAKSISSTCQDNKADNAFRPSS